MERLIMKHRDGEPAADRSIESPAIETVELTKQYSEVVAVDSLRLIIRRGEIYGFLGRNGAGKTTTIRLLLGLIKPTRGRVKLFGIDVGESRSEAVRSVGSLVETATYYPTLTVRENLEIQRRLTRTPREEINRAIDLLALGELRDRRVGRLSLGNRQRLALARALLTRPRLLVLDEPANALDPAGILEIRLLLRRLADDEGITVFVSSHILGEISQLADRIGIIHRGRLIEEIDARAAGEGAPERLELRVSEPVRVAQLIREGADRPQVTVAADGTLQVAAEALHPERVARLVVESGADLFSLSAVREDLEAHFMRLTGGKQ